MKLAKSYQSYMRYAEKHKGKVSNVFQWYGMVHLHEQMLLGLTARSQSISIRHTILKHNTCQKPEVHLNTNM